MVRESNEISYKIREIIRCVSNQPGHESSSDFIDFITGIFGYIIEDSSVHTAAAA